MSDQQLVCQSDNRRAHVRAKGRNGIDFIEVEICAEHPVLCVYFLQKVPQPLYKANIRITGGRRIRDLQVKEIIQQVNEDEEKDDVVRIVLNKAGDLSTYRLCFVKMDNGKPTDEPMDGFDQRYHCLDFSFQANCASDLDCQSSALAQSSAGCSPFAQREPEINYLAKDYASFRQLILDRLALLIPDWHERHVPDLGITLIELLAYVGDYLSYFQDAVATEAYLDTARRRISVRRHVRLIDYFLHEGCNARTWVCVQVEGETVLLDPNDAYFVTGRGNAQIPNSLVLNEEELHTLSSSQYDVFEPLICKTIFLYSAHNQLCFYTWGDSECCLPKGAMRATLHYPRQVAPLSSDCEPEQAGNRKPTRKSARTGSAQPVPDEKKWLKQGDVLIFEEISGAKTGNPADADPRHRHAVRLTNVTYTQDDLYSPPVQLAEIEWGVEDALPFAFCISALIAPSCQRLDNISVARGNAILVDHGRSMEDDLAVIPSQIPLTTWCEGEGQPGTPRFRPARYDLTLPQNPITHSVPLADESVEMEGAADVLASLPSARALLAQDPHKSLPVIALTEHAIQTYDATARPVQRAQCLLADVKQAQSCWKPKIDLLGSGLEDRHFVAEVDNEGLAHLRFGNGELGAAPPSDHRLRAHYRVGGGSAGNVGADSIKHLVYRRQMVAGIIGLGNPLPAQGGVDPEPIAEAKLFAPHAFRNQLQRAIRADDYARLALNNSKLQGAAGSLRWNGSWYTAQVAVDPVNQSPVNQSPVNQGDVKQSLLDEIEQDLGNYRRIGYDLEVVAARYVPIELALDVCVKAHFLRGHVKAALLDLFSNRRLPDGRLGFFHPDNLTFGKPIYLSEIVRLAQNVAGVESVSVTTLRRQGESSDAEAKQTQDTGLLKIGPLEIAQLDNDPAQPENGKLTLNMGGER